MIIFILTLVGGLFGFGFAVAVKRDVVLPDVVGAALPFVVGALMSDASIDVILRHVNPNNVRFIGLVFAVIGACWAAILADHRRRSIIGWAVLGFFLPLPGVIFAALAPKLPTDGNSTVPGAA